MSTPRTAGVVLAWLVSVAAATAVAMVAIGAVGSGIVDRGPRALSESEVAALLTSLPADTPASDASTTGGPATSGQPTGGASTGDPATGTATTTPSTPAAAQPVTRALTSAGGTVVARCTPGVAAAEIVSTTPAQGFRVESVEPEDGSQRVRFRAGSSGGGDGRVEVYVRCVDGRPVDNP